MLHPTARFTVLASALFALWICGSVEASHRRNYIVEAVERVRPSVVNIHSQKLVTSRVPGGAAASRMSGMGTGVIIDERGYIVTNHHVIEDVSSLRITLSDRSTYAAEVVARDPSTDIAILKINPLTPLPTMPMGSSEDLMQGETVIAIGNAFGYEHTVTMGIISELHRDVRLSDEQSYRNLIQTDASINPGNSGGPLINADGEMIGLNVAIRAGAQGISFAIPVDDVREVVSRLLAVRRLRGIWHGMAVRQASLADGDPGRVVVERIEPSSPADQAGLAPGDRILRINEFPIQASFDIERALLDKDAGEQVQVAVRRSGKVFECGLRLGRLPGTRNDASEQIWAKLGVRLDDPVASDVRQVSAQLRGGLRVIEVANGSPASRAGIQSGDILVGLHEYETLTPDNVLYVLKQTSREASAVRFFVVRAGQLHRGWVSFDDRASNLR